MVKWTKRRYQESRGKKMQYVSVMLNGEIVPYNSGSHIKINIATPGDEFTLTPVFVDETRMKKTDDHAGTRPEIVIISGPVIRTGEYKFKIDTDYFGNDPKRLWSGITLCVEADGDSQYKSAVQEINIK